ncbi:acetyltransferase [Niabella ginsengisoli]|uniref:acetyltransferase n=1 Tax=Niabella ginsengisoli TaxID=522298 RepID=UPI0021D416F2|nr:acetyltransferase [Niabella ginsengisoli]
MIHQLFTEPHHFFYSKPFDGSTFYIRSMQLEQDLDLIHRWVNAPHAHRFWQMQGAKKDLRTYYLKQKEENITSTFFVCNEQQPIALFDVYQVIWTALRSCYDARPSDYGIHLLMAPPRELIPLKKTGALYLKTYS